MKRSLTALTISLVMLALTAFAARAERNILVISAAGALSSNVDCEGNACTQVALTFDEAKQQYKVQNNSTQLIRVKASNLAGG